MVLRLMTCFVILSLFSGCGSAESVDMTIDLPEQLVHTLGDVMASIDEAGKGSAVISTESVTSMANCGSSQFSSCSTSTTTVSYSGCSTGQGSMAGDSILNWSIGTSCALASAGQFIRITPNYTITSSSGYTRQVTKSGTHAYTLTWTGGAGAGKTFSFTNGGVNHLIEYDETTLFNVTTTTGSAMTVTGESRAARSLSGGTFVLTNGVNGETCTFVPSNLQWNSTSCNCPRSGSWTGTCSVTGAYTLSITDCGIGQLSYIEDSQAKLKVVSLNRCLQN